MVEKLICLHNEIQLVTKINTFFIVFPFDDDENGLKIKKSKIASKFWYIYGSGTFFFFVYEFFVFFLRVPSASLIESAQIEGHVRLPVHPSCVFVIPVSGPAVSGARFLFLFSCFLSCQWAGP